MHAVDEKWGNALARLSSTLIGLSRVLSSTNAGLHHIIGQTLADIYASVIFALYAQLRININSVDSSAVRESIMK